MVSSIAWGNQHQRISPPLITQPILPSGYCKSPSHQAVNIFATTINVKMTLALKQQKAPPTHKAAPSTICSKCATVMSYPVTHCMLSKNRQVKMITGCLHWYLTMVSAQILYPPHRNYTPAMAGQRVRIHSRAMNMVLKSVPAAYVSKS